MMAMSGFGMGVPGQMGGLAVKGPGGMLRETYETLLHGSRSVPSSPHGSSVGPLAGMPSAANPFAFRPGSVGPMATCGKPFSNGISAHLATVVSRRGALCACFTRVIVKSCALCPGLNTCTTRC